MKDGIYVAGLETIMGSYVFDIIAEYDALVVSPVLDAGARKTGKTRMDDAGKRVDRPSSQFGAVLNPVQLDHLAGGSRGKCRSNWR